MISFFDHLQFAKQGRTFQNRYSFLYRKVQNISIAKFCLGPIFKISEDFTPEPALSENVQFAKVHRDNENLFNNKE